MYEHQIKDAAGNTLSIEEADGFFILRGRSRMEFHHPDDLLQISLVLELAASKLRSTLDGTPIIPDTPPGADH